jgi:hypothetical protein
VAGRAGKPHATVIADVQRARDLASYYGWTGDADRCVTWLERAFALSLSGIDFRILRSPLFEPVANAAGFRAAVDRVEAEVWQRTQSEWERVMTSPTSD